MEWDRTRPGSCGSAVKSAAIWARQEWRPPRKALAVPPRAVLAVYHTKQIMGPGTESDASGEVVAKSGSTRIGSFCSLAPGALRGAPPAAAPAARCWPIWALARSAHFFALLLSSTPTTHPLPSTLYPPVPWSSHASSSSPWSPPSPLRPIIPRLDKFNGFAQPPLIAAGSSSLLPSFRIGNPQL